MIEKERITDTIKLNSIRLILALLLLLCLFSMPYGYYQFVRIAATIGFLFLAHNSKQLNQSLKALIYLGLAILFQPLLKVYFSKNIWNAIDIIVGLWLLVETFLNLKRQNDEN